MKNNSSSSAIDIPAFKETSFSLSLVFAVLVASTLIPEIVFINSFEIVPSLKTSNCLVPVPVIPSSINCTLSPMQALFIGPPWPSAK